MGTRCPSYSRLSPYKRDRKNGWIVLFELRARAQTLGARPRLGVRGAIAIDRADRPGPQARDLREAGVGHLWFIDPTHHTLEALALDKKKRTYTVVASAGDGEKGRSQSVGAVAVVSYHG